MYVMARRYRPKPFNGRVVLFRRSRRAISGYLDAKLGWGHLVAGEFDVVVAESDHDAMFDEPQVQHVAAELAARLRGNAVFRPTIRSNMAPAHCRHRVKEEIPEHRDGTQSERTQV
jgi:hypothetical protein